MLKYPQLSLCDRPWGVLQLTGSDRARFLHNQSTNNILELQTGQSCDTVFVTSTGRTLDLATVYILPDSILLLVSLDRCQFIFDWMDRYIFPLDKVELENLTSDYSIFTLIGSDSSAFLCNLGLTDLPGVNSFNSVDYLNTQIIVANGSGLALPGYTLLVPQKDSQAIWQLLSQFDNPILTEQDWEILRIKQGRPAPNKELTEDYNPLEAGLWYCISFNKGCYIGQETITRLNTYQGVKQRLWGIRLQSPVAPATIITLGEDKIGILTSCTNNFGLGYIRTKAGGEGLTVQLGDVSGEVVAVPFLTHEYYR